MVLEVLVLGLEAFTLEVMGENCMLQHCNSWRTNIVVHDAH